MSTSAVSSKSSNVTSQNDCQESGINKALKHTANLTNHFGQAAIAAMELNQAAKNGDYGTAAVKAVKCTAHLKESSAESSKAVDESLNSSSGRGKSGS